MRRHPKFIQTTTNNYMEIESYFDGKFKIAKVQGMFYDIDKAVFFRIEKGREVRADLQAKYPDMFKQWQRQEERKLTVLRKQNITRL